jgi:hypothetical protein
MVSIGMPLLVRVIGIPIAIIEFSVSQQSFIISICEESIGIIRHTMPSLAISQFIFPIIGPRIIMGIIIGVPIIGIGMPIPPIIDIGMPIPPIMGIGMPIPIIGIPCPIIPGIIPPIIGMDMPDIGIIGMPGIWLCIGMLIDIGLIGIAFIAPSRTFGLDGTRLLWRRAATDAMRLGGFASF